MDDILKPIESLIPDLKHVTISQTAIEKFAANIKSDQLEGSEYNSETLLDNATEEELICFTFVYNSVNFSYWGQPKWTIEVDGKNYDGSAAMIRALKRGARERNLLNADTLANLSSKDLLHVFRGNVQIPLFTERLKLLNSLGKTIRDNYASSFKSFIDQTGWNAEKLTHALAEKMPDIFNDTVIYRKNHIHFYKRAQLVSAHLYDLARFNKIGQRINGFDKITAFADYKVPQLMRNMGILIYNDELSNKIDNQIELQSGSEEEVEIRISTIWANEVATRKLKERIPYATAAEVDGIIWFAGQNNKEKIKPYHRTRTIWY